MPNLPRTQGRWSRRRIHPSRALLVRLAVAAPATACCALARPALALDGPQFESPPVHPVELSADGDWLYAVHQADHRLVVFDLSGPTPRRDVEIFVGLEPVSVRERIPGEVWVVNHLSDSISIVDPATGEVTATLVVGDEPTDVVFAGEPERAFVAVSQENLVRIYDPTNLAATPVTVPLAMEEPLALGVSPDGGTVWVAAMNSGNRTTIVDHDDVILGGGPPPPNPPMRPDLPEPPATGLIVSHDGNDWVDESGRSWSAYVPYTLLDYDVVGIDTGAFTSPHVFHGVGTTLFGLTVAPDGRIYVANQDAFNATRFEPNVRGRFLENRVTVIDPLGGTVSPRHLNEHIDYGVPEGNAGERAQSLSIPTALAVGTSGEVYVAAFGSARVGVLDVDGRVTRRIGVGDGPCGLAYDGERNRLYVLRRVPGALDVVDLGTDTVVSYTLGFDPTPAEVHAGRKRFYDGEASSAHGDLSCASCHVYGSSDHLAWDLGDPEGDFVFGETGAEFHPMKGPLMTQSLQGLPGTTPLHWRGDRRELIDFNGAFVSLMGRTTMLADYEFIELDAFISSLVYPPNPYRDLDGSFHDELGGPSATKGAFLFENEDLFLHIPCTGCHELPTGTHGLVIPKAVFDGQQDLDVPQLRGLYEKRGFDEHASQNVRGFGYTHDGATGNLLEFFEEPRFTFERPEDRTHVLAFLLQFDPGIHAAVGAQWTTDGRSDDAGRDRMATLAAAAGGALGVIAKGRDAAGDPRGWVLRGNLFFSDRAMEDPLDLAALLALASPERPLTFTGVYPGTEQRLGVDRDLDGYLDRDELDQGSDPGDPTDPGAEPSPADIADGNADGSGGAGEDPGPGGGNGAPDHGPFPQLANGRRLHLEPVWPNPASDGAKIAYTLRTAGPVALEVHDVSGRTVRSLALQGQTGRNQTAWDLRDGTGAAVPAGLYFVRVRAAGEAMVRRLVVGG